MKILHTSDWHLGQIFHQYDRLDEQAAMLDELCAIVARHRPDAMVVSGDIFHMASPSTAAQKVLAEKMEQIHQAVPEMKIVLTAGNHDSASRHEAIANLWDKIRVHVSGVLPDMDRPERNVVEISGRGFVAAIPYFAYPRTEVFQTVLDSIAQRNPDGLPVVLMAHLPLQGLQWGRRAAKDMEMVGGETVYPVEVLGEGYDYCALGHIHRAQTLPGTDSRVRYCGTPLATSFDEPELHSVTMVEIRSRGAAPDLTEIVLTSGIPLRTLPAEGFAPFDQAMEMLKEFPDGEDAYLRLNVEATEGVAVPANAHNLCLQVCRDKKARFCLVNQKREAPGKAAQDAPTVTLEEFLNLSPLEIAKRHCSAIGREFTSDWEEMLAQAVARVESRRQQ